MKDQVIEMLNGKAEKNTTKTNDDNQNGT